MAIIAVDCDEVLMESVRDLCKYVAEKYSHNWIYEDIQHYTLHNNDHIDFTHEECVMLYNDYFSSLRAKDAEPVEDALSALTHLKNQGHTLIVVTARNDMARDLTFHQLEKHYPNMFEDVVFAHHYTDNHIPKSKICTDIGAEYLIDDNIDYALEASENGIKVFLLERPWNSRREEENRLITRVKSRNDIKIPL